MSKLCVVLRTGAECLSWFAFRNTKIISLTLLMEVLKVKTTSTRELNNSQTKNIIELCVN